MAEISAIPSVAAWKTPAAGPRVTIVARPSRATWITLAATFTIRAGAVARTAVPSRAGWTTPAGKTQLRVTSRPATATWTTLVATLTMQTHGRIITTLTEALAQVAAGLPLTDAQRLALPDEYRERI